MKHTRITALLLVCALLLTLLTACGGGDPAPSPSQSTQIETTVPLVDTPDVVKELLGMSRDTPVLNVEGRDISAEEYLYCLSYVIEAVADELGLDPAELDWTANYVEDLPLTTYITDSAVETASFQSLVLSRSAQRGLTLSEEERADLDAQIAYVIEYLGGEDYYALQLRSTPLSDAAMRTIGSINYYYDDLQTALFGDGTVTGETVPTEQDYIDFAEGLGLLMSKHILIKTVNDDYSSYTDEEKADALGRAQDILAQIRAADDPEAKFDELMNEYSEDGRTADGKLGAPDGYLFGEGQMVDAFFQGTLALDYHEISDLVESEYGYHIILRLPPVNDDVRQAWPTFMMDTAVDSWMAEVRPETLKAFSSIDPQEFYTKLLAYRDTLVDEAEALDAAAQAAGETSGNTGD